MSTDQAKFDGWAVVDVMGHQRYVGYVTTEAFGQAVLFRIEVPALEERERLTKSGGYHDGTYVPPGSTVKEGAVAGYSKLVGSGSIYTITPCTKDAAFVALEESQHRPLTVVALAPKAQLVAGEPEPDDDSDDDGDDYNGDDSEHDEGGGI